MELMPHHEGIEQDEFVLRENPVAATRVRRPSDASLSWQEALPVMKDLGFTLREVQASDAPSLLRHLTTPDVSRFISPPPTTAHGFERFIAWAHRERHAGRYACFAVVPVGQRDAVGLFQIRLSGAHDGVAEWGFILGQEYWGTGLFLAGALRVVAFAFEQMRLERLEARASVENARGNGALEKLGAVAELMLRRSFERHGRWHDQLLWAIVRGTWVPGQTAREPVRH